MAQMEVYKDVFVLSQILSLRVAANTQIELIVTPVKDPIHMDVGAKLYTYMWERSSQDMTALICYYVTHPDWWHCWWPDVPSVCNYYAESMFGFVISP